MKLDRPPHLPQIPVTEPELPQVNALAPPIADLLADRERAFVKLDRPPHLPQIPVALPEALVAVAVGPLIGEVALKPFVQRDRAPIVAPEHQIVEVDAVQYVGGGVVVAGVVAQLELGELRGEITC